MTKKRKTYTKEVEAAWYALKEFIDPLNCSIKFEKQAIQMNYNYVLCHHYSGTKVFPVFHYSKKLLNLHLNNEESHYYRSKRQARHCTGFGQTEKQALSTIFSKELNISKKREEYGLYYLLLLGIDIDCHNGEPDVQQLADWLRTNYFPQSYWEPSTNGLGRHGYVKIAYPDDVDIEYVRTVIEEFFDLLRIKAEQLGFIATLDMPCGLPLSLTYDNSVEKPVNLPTLSIKEFNKYRNLNSEIEAGETVLSKFISGACTYEEIYNFTKLRLPVTIKQSQCIKIPRFNCSDSKANLTDIQYFYSLVYMKFSHISCLKDNLIQELNIISKKKETHQGESEEDIYAGIVGSPTGNTEIVVLQNNPQIMVNYPSSQGKKEENIYAGIVGSPKEPEIITKTKKSYSEYIKVIRTITDTMSKTKDFYFYYADYLGYVPDVTTAIDEYCNQKLNTNPDKGSEIRIRRFEFVRKQLIKKWDLKKRGLKLSDWKDYKDKVIPAVEKKLTCINRTYVKDKKRNQIYEIPVEELAFIYFAIQKSNASDKHKKSAMKYCFSLKQVKESLLSQFGKFCPKVKAVRIRQILLEAGLIDYAGKYRVGEHGNCYKAVELILEQPKSYGVIVRPVDVFPSDLLSNVVRKGSMFRTTSLLNTHLMFLISSAA